MQVATSEKLHCLGGFNPFHNGHLTLLQGALEFAPAIDLSVGRKPKPHRLPWELRGDAARLAIEAAGIHDRVRLITEGRKDIDPTQYGGTLMGSNLLLEIFDQGPKILKKGEKDWFMAFPRLVVCERHPNELTSGVLDRAGKVWSRVDIFPTSEGSVSGTLCCVSTKRGESIESLVPPAVWLVIEPYLNVLSRIAL